MYYLTMSTNHRRPVTRREAAFDLFALAVGVSFLVLIGVLFGAVLSGGI